MTDYLFILKAAEYWHAARLVIQGFTPEAGPVEPACFLLNHASELTFKHFLHHKGVSDEELRALGHDLKKLWRACEDHGLAPDRKDVAAILRNYRAHLNHNFRYPWLGGIPYTRPTIYIHVVARLIDLVGGRHIIRQGGYGPDGGPLDWQDVPLDDIGGAVEGYSISLLVVDKGKP